MRGRPLLRVGDRVVFGGLEHTVVAVAGTTVRLLSASGEPSMVLAAYLFAAADFEVIGSAPVAPLTSQGLLDGLPKKVADAACRWERHLIEVETGLPPDAAEGTAPRPEYDPDSRSLAEREKAKAAELKAGLRTVQRMRRRYREQGLWGLVDGRYAPRPRPTGNVDSRIVRATVAAIEAQTGTSTGTKARILRQVERFLTEEYGEGVVAMPSRATFYRLVVALSAGRHTFGSAVTRRQIANRPTGVFTATVAARPGEQVQIDTTPLDVMAVMDDGVLGRTELTIAVDIATRTICAAVLHPAGTKAVDAALILARMVVPEPVRPNWDASLRMSASRIPHARLVNIDTRLELTAARPVIVPDTIVIDRGKVYLSETFLRACRTLGISVQPCHPRSPAEKGVVERTFSSINSLFTQHLAGYTGRDVTRRGSDVESRAAWPVADLQDLLDEWIVAGWQMRPHEGLRHPLTPDRPLSPNEAYAAMVAAAGYVPVTPTGEDYIEMLPALWRGINDYGVQIDYRTYNSSALAPYRRRGSGVAAQRGAWEVHYDPYDLTRVWVRDHHKGGWITAEWTQLPLIRQPFADFTWRYARTIAAARGVDATKESSVAVVLAGILKRAEEGPGPERRATAKARAATAMPRRLPVPLQAPPVGDEPDDEDSAAAEAAAGGEVVPFGLYDPFAEGDEQ
ncbi:MULTISPECIES: Mu transposase C-terminal domain-containing protein [unclassified Streptomyces]|uniref:Mu transposase C-terminal domain-containing protein n=1 Tax=unclassified Streptomyces TaxID=2593676 RepID=UPI00380C25F9